MLLAIDTSAGTSVAVVDRDRGTIASRSETGTRSHAEVIGTLIADCLAQSEVPIAALSGVAVGMGPGPFTGLRVGIAAAQAFALGAGKPLVRVVSHDAVAFGRYQQGFAGRLLVVTDARRREVYWSAYSGADAAGIPQRVGEPGLSRPDDLATGGGRLRTLRAAGCDRGVRGIRRPARRSALPTPQAVRRPGAALPALAGCDGGHLREAGQPVTWQLRRATRTDLAAIMALETSIFTTDAWSSATMARDLENPQCYYLVAFRPETPETIDGYAGLFAPNRAGEADIQTIAVAESSRRGGLGRVLVLSLIAEARRRGAREVFLEVRADNPGAQTPVPRARIRADRGARGLLPAGRRRRADHAPDRARTADRTGGGDGAGSG